MALILLVHERAGYTSETIDERPSLFGWGRTKSKLMFMPILGYDDGYGFTYGGRVSTIGLLGGGERLSAPLTWGGTRRAAIEMDRTFSTGPLTRVESTFGIWQRENPHYEIDEQRVEWTARAERSFARVFRAGVDTSQSTVEFGTLDDRLWTLGAYGGARYSRRSGLPTQRRLRRRGMDRPARQASRPTHQPMDHGRARLPGRNPASRPRRPRSVHDVRSHAS